MKIHLRFFASLRERVHASEADRDLPDGTTVGDAWEAVCREHPQAAPLGAAMSFAVNREYVARAHALRDGDELALIPPVSGGC